MRRKSDRKSKSSPEKKTETPATRRSHRRRRQKSTSSSPEHEEAPTSNHENDDDIDPTPNLDQTVNVAKQETSNSNSEEEKPDEQPVWQVKSAETPAGGEIQKLKICLARPSSTPERVEKSPRRHKKHRGGTSLSQTDEDSCEEKIKSRKKHKHHDNEEEIVESSSEDKMLNREEAKIVDEQNSSDSQQVSSTDIDENSKPNDCKEVDIRGECAEDQVYTAHISVDTQNGPESTISDVETLKQHVEPVKTSEDDSTETKQTVENVSEQNNGHKTPEATEIIEATAETTVEDIQKSELPTAEDETVIAVANISVEPMDVDPTPTTEQLEDSIEPVSLRLHSPDVSMADAESAETEACVQKDDTAEQPAESTREDENVVEKGVEDQNAVEEGQGNKNAVEKNVEDETRQEEEKSTTPEPLPQPQPQPEVEQSDETEKTPEVQEKEADEAKSQSTENSPEVHKEYHREVSQETNDSSSEDRSPVRNSVVSVVSQVQPVEPEPVEEPTYVADPSRKKIKLKEAATECIPLGIPRLSSETVREICPDLKILALDEIRLEDEVRLAMSESDEVTRKVKKKPFEDKKITIQSASKEFTATPPTAANPMLANRKISIVSDDASVLHRPPSPAKNQPSPILYIKNLVRPFTLNQLKELLSRTGTIKENGFWINKIKSECYVHYETLEQSVETRNALHGVHWPVANGRRLDVDFGTEEAMEKARAPTETKPEIKPEAAAPETKPKEETVDWREERERERIRREQRGVREWDVGKQGQERSPTPPPKRRLQSPPSRAASPERKSRKKEDVPSKLLDDLFRKTKATPCIYWLPLSAEMIVIKEEQRRKHMAEHERRLAEIRRVERERERMRRMPGRSRDGRSRYD